MPAPRHPRSSEGLTSVLHHSQPRATVLHADSVGHEAGVPASVLHRDIGQNQLLGVAVIDCCTLQNHRPPPCENYIYVLINLSCWRTASHTIKMYFSDYNNARINARLWGCWGQRGRDDLTVSLHSLSIAKKKTPKNSNSTTYNQNCFKDSIGKNDVCTCTYVCVIWEEGREKETAMCESPPPGDCSFDYRDLQCSQVSYKSFPANYKRHIPNYQQRSFISGDSAATSASQKVNLA